MADTKISALSAATTPLAGTEVLPIVQSGTTVKVAVSNLTAGRDIAAASLTTAVVQAASSAGGTLKNNGGTAQMQWGSGGGSNLSLEVATNINPANAAVNISPTGTGTVTINPATASTMNNVAIGGTTALAGRFTSVTATTGNFVVGTSGQGIDFSATPGTGTSELLADYEEGTWTPTWNGGTVTVDQASYTKIGRQVFLLLNVTLGASVSASDSELTVPFTATSQFATGAVNYTDFGAAAFVNLRSSTNKISFRAAANTGSLTCASVAGKQFIFEVNYIAS